MRLLDKIRFRGKEGFRLDMQKFECHDILYTWSLAIEIMKVLTEGKLICTS